MRWTELLGREIINLDDGAKLGKVGDADLAFDPETGAIDSVVIAGRRSFGWLGFRSPVTVPWEAIRRLGPEVVLVEMSAAAQQARGRRQG